MRAFFRFWTVDVLGHADHLTHRRTAQCRHLCSLSAGTPPQPRPNDWSLIGDTSSILPSRSSILPTSGPIAVLVALEKLYDEHYPNNRLNFGTLAQLGRLLLHRNLGHAELLDKRRRHPSLQSALLEMVNSEEFALKNGKPGHLNP